VEDGPLRTDLDVKGTAFGAAAFVAVNPSLVLGLRATQERAEYENTAKEKNTVLQPSVTYSPVSGLSLAAQVNIIRASLKIEGADELTSKVNNFTLGMTAHQEAWEGTVVISTKKDGDEEELAIPQKVGLHGRYRIAEPITLGLSFEQRDYSSIAEDGFEAEDETRIGVHMEASVSETVAVEFDYYATTADHGEKDSDGSEFVLLGQTLLTSTLEAGLQLAYETIDANGQDSKLVRPGLFLSTKF
jgi:long-subunit fatty acid transport protein